MNQFGKNIRISLFGESHGEFTGITIDGIPEGIHFDTSRFDEILIKRQGDPDVSTPRRETNEFKIISGYFENHTTGAPLTILIKNNNIDSSSYQRGVIRPSHGDLSYNLKYNHNNDYRGGGTCSGRLTAPLVLLKPICEEILNKLGYDKVKVRSIIKKIGNLEQTTSIESLNLNTEINPFINESYEIKVKDILQSVKANGDSLGGTIETAVTGIPQGIGEPFFDSIESIIAHLLFSIPGIKAVEFGEGTNFSLMLGSQANDALEYNGDKIVFLTNHAGGINGGISNGNIITFRTTFRPTPSIRKEIPSINTLTKENIIVSTNGRHDPCIALRGLYVVNALTYFAITDLILERMKNE